MKWEPIETAPRDATAVDVWSGGRRIPNARWMTPVCHVEEYKAWCMEEHEPDGRFGSVNVVYVEIGSQPTHWLPIPGPPEEDGV